VKPLDLSIVVAAYNEAPNLEPLHGEIRAALAPLGLAYELVLVDDGSDDGSYDILRDLQRRDPDTVRVVRLRRNFGQTAAWAAGFDHVRGRRVAVLDADLQNDPADIPSLLAKLDEGYELVNGWRVNRQDSIDRRLPSRIANPLVRWVTGVHVTDFGCSLRAFDAGLLPHIQLYGEMHRYLPALFAWVGARMTEVPVNHRPRTGGRQKYGLGRSWRVLIDLITLYFLRGFSASPMRLFGGLGLFTSAVGFALAAYLSVLKLAFRASIGNRPLLLLAVLLIVIGLQLVIMGLLGELIVRVYHESQGKTIYIVREVLEASASESQAEEEAPIRANA
jgi:glycosyltransferase involved in cell wall biosynthesis